jgi:hypothetical protein
MDGKLNASALRPRGWLIVILLVCGLCGLTVLLGMKVWRFLEIDSCMDAGGKWDYAKKKCIERWSGES